MHLHAVQGAPGVFWWYASSAVPGQQEIIRLRGESSAVGLQLRVRFVPAALLAMRRTALAPQCVVVRF
jgi:hypothetical protein